MNELIWIKVDGFWQLYVNDKITIKIVNGCPDAYSIWIAIKDINFRGGFYNNIEDAKTKGLEVAQARIYQIDKASVQRLSKNRPLKEAVEDWYKITNNI